MLNNLAMVLAAAFATALVVRFIVSLVRQLRRERARQAPQGRSTVWLLVACGGVAYLMAYFAFEGDLQAPIRLAFVGIGIASVPAVQRLLR
jgi:hypothetical protein